MQYNLNNKKTFKITDMISIETRHLNTKLNYKSIRKVTLSNPIKLIYKKVTFKMRFNN